MNEVPKERIDEIIKTLEKRRATRPCPRCGNRDFTIESGYFNQPIQSDLKGLSIGGRSIPSAIVICIKCGYISQHALGVLGLLPREGETRYE